jgi:hypothetical protein
VGSGNPRVSSHGIGRDRLHRPIPASGFSAITPFAGPSAPIFCRVFWFAGRSQRADQGKNQVEAPRHAGSLALSCGARTLACCSTFMSRPGRREESRRGTHECVRHNSVSSLALTKALLSGPVQAHLMPVRIVQIRMRPAPRHLLGLPGQGDAGLLQPFAELL